MLIGNGSQVVFLVWIPCNIFFKTLCSVSEGYLGTAFFVSGQEFPSLLVSIVIGLGTNSRDDGQVISRIVFLHMNINGVFEFFKTCEKFLAPIFVSDTQIVETEWLFVSHITAESGPFIGKVCADGKIDQVCKVLDIFFLQFATGWICVVGTSLTENTAGHNRKRFCL